MALSVCPIFKCLSPIDSSWVAMVSLDSLTVVMGACRVKFGLVVRVDALYASWEETAIDERLRIYRKHRKRHRLKTFLTPIGDRLSRDTVIICFHFLDD